jgi:hypothetical protein
MSTMHGHMNVKLSNNCLVHKKCENTIISNALTSVTATFSAFLCVGVTWEGGGWLREGRQMPLQYFFYHTIDFCFDGRRGLKYVGRKVICEKSDMFGTCKQLVL